MRRSDQDTLPAVDVGDPIANELQELAKQIKDRNKRLDRSEGTNALENGRDLLRIKELVGHGNFGRWCKRELAYSKSKAEKEMRVAEVLGPYFKSLTVTDLLRRTLAYDLSAGTTPQEIRDEFMPRIIAGEEVDREVKSAIDQHRAKVNEAKQEGNDKSQACTAKVQDKVSGSGEAQVPATTTELKRATASYLEALDLIMDRVGADLPLLVTLLDKAGTEVVFTPAAERVLRDRSLGVSPSVDRDATQTADTSSFECTDSNQNVKRGKFGDISIVLSDYKFFKEKHRRANTRG